jgi:hypothetical protein
VEVKSDLGTVFAVEKRFCKKKKIKLIFYIFLNCFDIFRFYKPFTPAGC